MGQTASLICHVCDPTGLLHTAYLHCWLRLSPPTSCCWGCKGRACMGRAGRGPAWAELAWAGRGMQGSDTMGIGS